MATLAQLEEALVNADAAGDMEAARILAAAIVRARSNKANLIPGAQIPPTSPPEDPSVMERAVGTGEAALTTVTGATGGAVGMIGGTLKGLAEQILSGEFGTQDAEKMVEKEAMKGAQALTYSPRTEQGQQQAAAVGEALQQLPPVIPVAGSLGAITSGVRQAVPIGREVAGQAAAQGRRATQAVRERLSPKENAPTTGAPTPGTMGSFGAAGVDIATLRREKAAELGFVGDKGLTKGQATRGFDETRFERETAKLPEIGEPLRQRFGNQQKHFGQVLDGFLDETGAETASLRAIGESVGKALRDRAARDKVKIRTLYKEAEKRGELEAPVILSDVAAFLTSHGPEEAVANVLTFAKSKGRSLGIFADDGAGGIVATPAPLKNVELFRRSINNATNFEPTNIHFAGMLKATIDDATEGLGGKLYKQARNARRKYAHDYENIPIVKQLLNNKRGTEERAIALEHVLNKVVLEPSTSLDSMRQVKRLLQAGGGGEEGKQAWREIQGGVIQHIKDQALKSVAPDQFGNQMVSPSQLERVITKLDRSGKLDYIFGKRGAEKLRVISDVAKDVLTVPPGSVNTSNTATVLAGLMDVAISGTSGVPAPVMTSFRLLTKNIKDSRLKAKVRETLGE